jgi:uncharacterized protein (UPF0548 family)
MLLVRRPTRAQIDAFLGDQSATAFSYAHVGATRSSRPPSGFNIDHNRVRIGTGEAAFTLAVAALRRWAMFDIGWVTLCWPSAPIETGRTVGVLVSLYGLWSLNACRVVYTTVDDDEDVRRFGFAYGTLADHMESGEERFTIEWRRDDDSVWYDLFAVSRPHHPLAWLGLPLSRALQRRFARESLRAMTRASQR